MGAVTFCLQTLSWRPLATDRLLTSSIVRVPAPLQALLERHRWSRPASLPGFVLFSQLTLLLAGWSAPVFCQLLVDRACSTKGRHTLVRVSDTRRSWRERLGSSARVHCKAYLSSNTGRWIRRQEERFPDFRLKDRRLQPDCAACKVGCPCTRLSSGTCWVQLLCTQSHDTEDSTDK